MNNTVRIVFKNNSRRLVFRFIPGLIIAARNELYALAGLRNLIQLSYFRSKRIFKVVNISKLLEGQTMKVESETSKKHVYSQVRLDSRKF